MKGNRQHNHVHCACATCMRGRGKEQCAAAHTAVWVRLLVLVVLTARLSLPGGAELKKLGPPTLPLCAPGPLLVALVGAKALHVSCVTH